MVMQAEWFGYEVRPWSRWKRENNLVAEFELSAPASEMIMALQIQATSLGARYDYISAGWTALFGWTGYKIKNGISRLMCSESVLRFLKLCPSYASRFEMLDPESTMPLDLLTRCHTLSQIDSDIRLRELTDAVYLVH